MTKKKINFKAVVRKFNRDKELHLICALPHPNFESKWKLPDKMKYHSILKKAILL